MRGYEFTSTRARTRSGCVAANTALMGPPVPMPITDASRILASSMTAATSSIHSSSVGNASSETGSERPTPRSLRRGDPSARLAGSRTVAGRRGAGGAERHHGDAFPRTLAGRYRHRVLVEHHGRRRLGEDPNWLRQRDADRTGTTAPDQLR